MLIDGDSDEEQEIPLLSSQNAPMEAVSKEEEENLRKSLETIEEKVQYLEEKINLLSQATKKLVFVLKSDDLSNNWAFY